MSITLQHGSPAPTRRDIGEYFRRIEGDIGEHFRRVEGNIGASSRRIGRGYRFSKTCEVSLPKKNDSEEEKGTN